jgi:hypothetical protein
MVFVSTPAWGGVLAGEGAMVGERVVTTDRFPDRRGKKEILDRPTAV